jgi:two-component system, response regulator RegA
MGKSILLVDDEDLFRDRLTRAFRSRGYTVNPAAGYEEALEILNRHEPELAVIDLKMPGRNGLDLVADGIRLRPALKMVVLTGYGSIATATEAIRLGALSFLQKPADADEIINAFAKEREQGAESRREEDFQVPSLARMEWEHINRVLHDCGGKVSVAARKLGIHRRSLQRKLQKYPPRF